jgi:GTP-binding protein YchF
MRVGLIGLPEGGKTTLFNALTRAAAAVHSYGAHTDEVNLGAVEVPDRRFDVAVELCRPKKRVPALLEVTDGGARVAVGDRGAKFGADFFAGVRNMDALLIVLRAFSSPSLPDPDGGINPRRDLERLIEELILADLVVVEARLERLDKSRLAKRLTASDAAEMHVLQGLHAHLAEGKPIRTVEIAEEDAKCLRSFAFVSGKPLIVVTNIGEDDLGGECPHEPAVAAYTDAHGIASLTLCAKVEADVAQMSPDEESEFLEALGIAEPARDRVIREAYQAVGYISFLTVGEDEVRAWTLRRGSTALAAAASIHTDIARTFIRAEVMAFERFEEAGGWDAAKAAGHMHLEGKEYIVHDGEIVHIRNSKG